MNRLILVALMAVGVAVGVPAARTSHAAGIGEGGEGRDTRDGRVDVSVSRVECPASKANVVMTAPRDHGTVEYSVYRGDTLVRNGLLWPGVQRTIPVYVEPRSTERIGVTLAGQGTTRHQVWSRCESGEESYGEYRESVYSESSESSDDEGSGGHRAESVRSHRYNPLIRQPYGRLPYTGPPADLWGKVATAGGLIVFGGMLWWVGLVWPRRTPAEPLMRPRPLYAPRRPPGA
ncbi:hypothetical protein DQ384_12910 [Sphaerisporangium album]|uniref:Uncharacterized protein n=1 Tax=Sphaerisporangium album TaxID=509200 RepID=A0A367FKE6_9ACTN|nr:hypothetical protein [Sphaerisporangium album]RCG30868.1 hypothetical protein DQ384_12910 [Sphaerisporangium album]